MLKKISLLTSILLIGLSTQAAVIFAPSISYMEQTNDDTTTETNAKLTVVDLRLGYTFDMGLYVGGLYSIQDHNLASVDSSDSYLGPTIGFYKSGFLIAGTYYFYGEKDLTDGSGKRSKVSGYQVDLSYTVPLTKSLRIGPQLTYYAIDFDEIEVNGFAQSQEFSFSGITPAFNLLFMF